MYIIPQFFVALFLLAAVNAHATTYWVAVGGGVGAGACTLNDGDTDPGAYMSTIQDGLSCLTLPGDVLKVKPGTYTEQLQMENVVNGSSASNQTRMESSDGLRSVTLNGRITFNAGGGRQHIKIDGFIIDGTNLSTGNSPIYVGDNTFLVFNNFTAKNGALAAAKTTGSSNGVAGDGDSHTFSNCDVHNNGQDTINASSGYAFYINGTNHIIEHCNIHSNGGYGVHAFKTTGGAGGIIVRWNRFWNNNTHSTTLQAAVVLASGTGHEAYGNVIFAENKMGIETFPSCSGCKVYNNTVYRTGLARSDHGIGIYTQGPGSLVRNNAFEANPAGHIVVEATATGSSYSNNSCFGTGGTSRCDVTADPRFVDKANSDFRLCTAAGTPHASCPGVSPLIGAGVTLVGSDYDEDIVGTTRTAPWDIGAYEGGIGVVEPPVVEPDPVLVAEISCDNTVVDSSGNANHGTLTSGATYSASGKYNSACSFDGVDDSVTLADSTTLDLTHGFTLEAWTFPTSVTTDAVVMVKNPNSKYGLFISLDGQCGTNATVGGFSEGSFNKACYMTATSLNTWTHHAVTYNRTSIIYYRNGVAVTTTAASAFLSATTGTLQIGNSGFSEPFTGLIDEVRIYNYARTAAQVLTDMNTPINASVPNTVTVRMASTTLKFAGSVLKFGSTTAAVVSYILLENGDNWLLEDGDDLLNQQ
jgi:hypothetical protein